MSGPSAGPIPLRTTRLLHGSVMSPGACGSSEIGGFVTSWAAVRIATAPCSRGPIGRHRQERCPASRARRWYAAAFERAERRLDPGGSSRTMRLDISCAAGSSHAAARALTGSAAGLVGSTAPPACPSSERTTLAYRGVVSPSCSEQRRFVACPLALQHRLLVLVPRRAPHAQPRFCTRASPRLEGARRAWSTLTARSPTYSGALARNTRRLAKARGNYFKLKAECRFCLLRPDATVCKQRARGR